MAEVDLEKMTATELREYALNSPPDITGVHAMKKEELVVAIKKARGEEVKEVHKKKKGAGKVKLDASIGTYLANYPNRDVATKLTIHYLLTHTGGTGDIFGPEFDANRLKLKTLNDYVTLYGKRGLEFEPGSRWEYSNYGFLLLGVIVEGVSGQNYYDYVRDHIFTPAGMTGSGSVYFSGEAGKLRFLTALAPATIGGGGIRLISFFVLPGPDGGLAVATVSPFRPGGAGSWYGTEGARILVPGATDVAFTYSEGPSREGRWEWLPAWEPKEAGSLPAAVRIEFTAPGEDGPRKTAFVVPVPVALGAGG